MNFDFDIATRPTLPPGFHWTMTNKVRTPAGLVIGGALRAPPPETSADAEAIQAALLAERKHRAEILLDWWNENVPTVIGFIVAVGLIVGIARKVLG
jgi:hypothetical protein